MQQMEKDAQLKQMDLISFVKIVKKYKKIFCSIVYSLYYFRCIHIFCTKILYNRNISCPRRRIKFFFWRSIEFYCIIVWYRS